MQNQPFRLTSDDVRRIKSTAAEIADGAPEDLNSVEVLAALTAASLVGARLGIPYANVLHAANAGYSNTPEAA